MSGCLWAQPTQILRKLNNGILELKMLHSELFECAGLTYITPQGYLARSLVISV